MNNTIKAGKLLRITEGEFSEYGVLGFFVVIQALDYTVELEKFLEENPTQRGDYEFDPDKFLGYLVSHGFLLELDHTVLHLGSYGLIENVYLSPLVDNERE